MDGPTLYSSRRWGNTKAMQSGNLFLILSLLAWSTLVQAVTLPRRDQVLDVARHMLENWNISYVMGGSRIGDVSQCEQCNSCLHVKQPDKSQRLNACPSCNQCSLDCSHFTFEVFKQAGLSARYLTTSMMNELDGPELMKQYQLVDIGRRVERAIPGDLLVYEGHVVMLERKNRDQTGDVIHVTSGRDLKGPGLAIQRERRANLAQFRGPLLRILRHLDLVQELRQVYLDKTQGPVIK